MSVTTVITDGGFDMLRAAPDHRLVYTRAVCGSGHVDKTRLAALTEVQGYAMDLSIIDVSPTEDAATVRLQLDNRRAEHEFQLYQIGLYAKLLGDGGEEIIGETLFQIMQYDQPDIVRKVPHVSEFVVNTIFGQAEDVEGIIDLAAYVSLRQFKLTIDRLIRSIMKDELALPLAAGDGEPLLTGGGTPILAVYHPDRSAGILAAMEAMAGQLSAGARAYTDKEALGLTAKIAAAKAEAVSAARADAEAAVHSATEKIVYRLRWDMYQHNNGDGPETHPSFLRQSGSMILLPPKDLDHEPEV